MVSDGGNEATREQGRTIPGIAWVVIAAVLVTGTGYFFLSGPDESGSMATTFVARKGTLDVVVLEGGIVEAQESQQLRSEVGGSSKILNIVEEGYQVTAEDVASGMILVELDTAELNDELISDQIAYESAKEQHIESEADYEITINENESSLKAAELKVKFARMDFQKFLGAKPVAEILLDLGLDEETLRAKARKEAAEKARMKSEALVEAAVKAGFVAADGSASPKFEDLIIDDELNQAIRTAFRAQMGEGGAGRPRSGGGGDASADGQRRSGRAEGGGGRQAGRGGGGGGMQLTPERVEQMRAMGVDVYDIARKAGKLKKPAATVDAPEIAADGSVVDVTLVYERPQRNVNFSKYTDVTTLEDGAALQTLRGLVDARLIADAGDLLAKSELAGSEKLYARGFVTQMDLDRMKIKVQNSNVGVEKAKTDQELYIKYEFPKMAEQLLSDFEEALMALERTQKMGASKLSQSSATMSAYKRRFLYEEAELEETKRDIANSVIRAERPGLVVYGSSEGSGDRHSRYGSSEPIMEGTTVRERQLILTIPDMTKMGVAVKVQEWAVQKVKVGLKVRMTFEQRPDELLEGEVVKVAVMPDAGDRWLNPDMKVYNVAVRINSVNDWLQPGMSSQVEILIDKLVDVVYVPIQAIAPSGKNRYVYVVSNGSVERRMVETGSLTDAFIEIKSGLSEGEVVQLNIPDMVEDGSPSEEDGPSSGGLFASN